MGMRGPVQDHTDVSNSYYEVTIACEEINHRNTEFGIDNIIHCGHQQRNKVESKMLIYISIYYWHEHNVKLEMSKTLFAVGQRASFKGTL